MKGSGIGECMKPVCGEGRVSGSGWRKGSLAKLEEIKLSRSCSQEPMRVYTSWMMVQTAKLCSGKTVCTGDVPDTVTKMPYRTSLRRQ